MSCIKKKEVLYLVFADKNTPPMKCYALGHDSKAPPYLLVYFPHTHHVARVLREWIKRPKKRGSRRRD